MGCVQVHDDREPQSRNWWDIVCTTLRCAVEHAIARDWTFQWTGHWSIGEGSAGSTDSSRYTCKRESGRGEGSALSAGLVEPQSRVWVCFVGRREGGMLSWMFELLCLATLAVGGYLLGVLLRMHSSASQWMEKRGQECVLNVFIRSRLCHRTGPRRRICIAATKYRRQ